MLKMLEFFGGIGAPRMAMENLRVKIKSMDYVEILRMAVQAYNAMFDNGYTQQDICEWNTNVDLLVHGSPCQDFSKNGLNDITSGRSVLYNRTLDIVATEIKFPRVVIWENVANLLSKTHRHHFDHYLETMESFGYTNYYKILNASDYGIPQNRERIFCVSVYGEHEPFEFPEPVPMRDIREFIDPTVNPKDYPLTEGEQSLFFIENNELFIHVNTKAKQLKVKEYDIINVERPTSKTRRGRIKQEKQMAQTLTTSQNQAVYINGYVRKLTALEHWRLMGFDDKTYSALKAIGIADGTIVQLAGNSIVVQVLEAIYKQLFIAQILTPEYEKEERRSL